MALYPFEIGFFLWSTGDTVGDVMEAFPGLLSDRLPLDHEHLSDMGEVEIIVKRTGSPDLPGAGLR